LANTNRYEGDTMTATRSTSVLLIAAFLLGFGLGGLSLHVASAQGVFGLKTSVSQIGSSLVEMQKNVDDLQKHMGVIKQVKDQLSSVPSAGGEVGKKEGDSLKQLVPGMGQK
jgi:hypothetical protein